MKIISCNALLRVLLVYVLGYLKSVLKYKFLIFVTDTEGRHSAVGIRTDYGLDGPGIESRCGRNFSQPSIPALGPHPALYSVGTGSFPGVKWPGRGVVHPPHLAPRLKKEWSCTSTLPWAIVACYRMNVPSGHCIFT
jgi:hypothetical protein